MSDFYGVVNGVYYCGMERTLELSQRMYERNVPSAPLQPAFSVRPVSSKYEMLPIYDRRAPATVPIHKEPTYNIGLTFNPGTAVAPWSGFATNVNVESSLRGVGNNSHSQTFSRNKPLLQRAMKIKTLAQTSLATIHVNK